MKKILITLFLVFLSIASSTNLHSLTVVKPRSIIMYIGDGMGFAQVTAAVMAGVGDSFLKFSRAGISLTYSSNSWITDSGASATALAAGKKTYNRAISVDEDKINLKSVVEYAEEAGMSTGLIATSSITHATPASFATHVEWRDQETEIARQLSVSGVDVLLGGGRKYFLPENEDGVREDGRNLLNEMKDKGYQIVLDMSDLHNIDIEKVNYLLGLVTHDAFDKDNNPDQSLAVLTEIAVKILSKNPKGYFLMVEGSQIDWRSHDNEYEKMLYQMEDFNDAINVGLEQSKRDQELLIIVTADHETGGLTLLKGNKDNTEFTPKWTTHGHTGATVPVFSIGPGEDLFSGLLDNDEIGKSMIRLIER